MLVAYGLQALVALGAAAAVVWVWRRPTGDPDMKNAALLAATPLSTAFIFDYDLMLLAPAIAWLARKGITDGALPYERTALVAVFLHAVCLARSRYVHAPASRTDLYHCSRRRDHSTDSTALNV